MIKKKRSSILLSLLFIFLMSGCSSIENKISQLMWEKSGVADEIQYIQYEQMKSAGALDEEGLYHSKELEDLQAAESEKPNGSVHVSFARNEFIQIEYYRDEALTEVLETFNCRLDPGDTIYASAPVLKDPVNELYRFSEIRVQELDENGNIRKTLAAVRDLPGIIFQIPEDFTGSDLCIVPLGKYLSRKINLRAVYRHPDETESLLENGVWYVNGKMHGNGSLELNPLVSYRIAYDYNTYQENWYYAGSEPDSYWDKSSDAVITFLADPSDISVTDYVVRLHPYGSMKISNGIGYQNVVDSLLDGAANIFTNKSIIETQNIIDLFQVNGITQVNNFSDTEITAKKIKAGDEILLRIPADLKVIADGLDLPDSVLKEDTREYRFLIPDTEKMSYKLTVSRRNSDWDGIFHESSVEKGVLNVFDSTGIRYHEGSELPAENEKINLSITPDEGYCIYGKNVKNNIYKEEMKYTDYAASISTLITDHPIKPCIVVTLDTEDDLGSCVFWTGQKMISGTVFLSEGQDLQFDYLLNNYDDYEIILTPEEKAQAADIWSPYAASRVIDVNESLMNTTLRCRDFITLRERIKTDDITDSY